MPVQLWPLAQLGGPYVLRPKKEGEERGRPTAAEARRGEEEWAYADGLRRHGRESEGPRAS